MPEAAWITTVDEQEASGEVAAAYARAADRQAAEYGERGLLAADLIPVMRRLLNGSR